jgi:hypothetical protein
MGEIIRNKIIRNKILPMVIVSALALPVAGQVTRSRPSATTETHVRTAPVPYTAEYRITRVQVLANGTTITRESKDVKALDSQGRRMTALTVTSESGDHAEVTHVFVFDPVAHTQTHWTSPGTRATVTPMLAPGTAHTCSPMAPDPDNVHVTGPHSTSTTENLGTAEIQGVEARGRRITRTIPAGAVGNEEPLVTTKEIWNAIAVGLNGLLVRDVTDDPRMGKSTRELTQLTQGDPDPATFQPPEGYEIVTRDPPGCPGEATTAPTSTSQ